MMKAVGYFVPSPIDAPNALLDLDLPEPVPGPRDLLVRVSAVSVNPVDVKIRSYAKPTEGLPKILGWDAVGVVEDVGEDVTLFRRGDRVFYAGAINRAGSNAEYQVVDERIVGHAPVKLSDAEAAALPLTTITAWEILFDRLGLARNGGEGEILLVVGGAGGVGSILTQLARQLTKVTIVATASRAETREWCLTLGAHQVIDHSLPLSEELRRIGLPDVDYAASLTASDIHRLELVKAIKPQGKLVLIDDPATYDIMPFKGKSISVHWELMFTRSLFQTEDMIKQHQLLDEVALLVEKGILQTTLADQMGPINASTLKKAHAVIESGKAKGKIVLQGF